MSGCLPPQTVAARHCDHAWIGHLKGGEPLTVRVCSVCGDPDWDDLREQVRAVRAAAIRQAADEMAADPDQYLGYYGEVQWLRAAADRAEGQR